MSINSIGFLGGYFHGNTGLSEETKQKLLALGIDPSTVVSEVQAKILIENMIKMQSVEKTASSKTSNLCTSECELISKTKILAKKIGLSDNMKLEEMFLTISAAINKKLSQPDIKNETLKSVRIYHQELSSLQDEFSIIKQNENAMFASMNFNANMNKMMLGLN